MTPIDAGLVARVSAGIKYIITGSNGFFGPSDPLPPVSQESQGRALDYPVAFNLQQSPRAYEPTSFQQLRAFADGYDLLRIIIETRKDQMEKQKWNIVLKDEDKKAKTKDAAPDPRIKELETFFAYPDKFNGWNTWLRMLLEELFVLDAPALYVRKTVGGQMFGFQPIDGATIKRIITIDGLTPMPPEAAYQQVLKGLPAIDYTLDELIYRPRNVRVNKLYGYGPVEQILMTVNIALRRQISQLNYYTAGNMPDAIITTPLGWSIDQVTKFQAYWDSIHEGNSAERRKAKFVPGGKETQIQFTKDQILKDEFDEWLARVICYAFSVSPTNFIKQVNRATAETAAESAQEEGLEPIMNWVKDLMDFLITKYFGYDDMEFSWREEEVVDPLVQSQIDASDVSEKIRTVDEVREMRGLEPLTDEQIERMKAMTPAPPPMIGDDGKPINPAQPGVSKKPGVAGDKPDAAKPGVAKIDGLKKKHQHHHAIKSY